MSTLTGSCHSFPNALVSTLSVRERDIKNPRRELDGQSHGGHVHRVHRENQHQHHQDQNGDKMPISDAPPSDRARLDQAHCADREAAYQQAIREVRCTQCGAAPGHRLSVGEQQLEWPLSHAPGTGMPQQSPASTRSGCSALQPGHSTASMTMMSWMSCMCAHTAVAKTSPGQGISSWHAGQTKASTVVLIGSASVVLLCTAKYGG